MYAPLIGMAAVSALVAALLTWGMARRYGRKRAVLIPVLAIVAAVFAVWRATGLDPTDAMTTIAVAMAFAGPSVAGALLGLLLVRSRGGQDL